MNRTELVKYQLREAELFKENILFSWVKAVAKEIIKIDKGLLQEDHMNDLVDRESEIQNLCDVFEGGNRDLYQLYKHRPYYKICLAKYDQNLEPFNHLRRVHDLMNHLK